MDNTMDRQLQALEPANLATAANFAANTIYHLHDPDIERMKPDDREWITEPFFRVGPRLELASGFVRANPLASAEALFIHTGARDVHFFGASFTAQPFHVRAAFETFFRTLIFLDALAADERTKIEAGRQAEAGPAPNPLLAMAAEDTIFALQPDPMAKFGDPEPTVAQVLGMTEGQSAIASDGADLRQSEGAPDGLPSSQAGDPAFQPGPKEPAGDDPEVLGDAEAGDTPAPETQAPPESDGKPKTRRKA